MTAAQRTIIGVAMAVTGIVLALIALPVGWHATQRWLAISEVRAAQIKLRSGHVDDARRLAEKASARVPYEITPRLIAIDPAQAADLERIQALIPQIRRSDDRAAAVATIAMGRALLGLPIGVDLGDGAEAKWIAAIAALREGKDFTVPADTGGDVLHLAVQRVAWTLALRRAMELKQAEQISRWSGLLIILCPSDPQVRAWRMLRAGLQTQAKDKEVIYLGEQLPELQRQPIVRM
ncbi:MAG: hypothetical protein AAB263_12440, partial [Planctomycetota bacterium]